MKWNNLKLNKCPKCGKDLQWAPTSRDGLTPAKEMHKKSFSYCSCGFTISDKRMKEIITSQVDRTIESHYRPDDEVPEPKP